MCMVQDQVLPPLSVQQLAQLQADQSQVKVVYICLVDNRLISR